MANRPRLDRRWAPTALLAGWLWALGSTVAAQPLTPQRYIAWSSDGSRAGSLEINTEPGGDTVARYQYKNNGRGPETVERYRLADDGTPMAYRVNGSSTMGSVIDEQFERDAPRDGARARWRSPADTGDAAAPGAAL